MTKDMSLLERLRWLDTAYDHAWHTDWAREAADEIESLRSALSLVRIEAELILDRSSLVSSRSVAEKIVRYTSEALKPWCAVEPKP